ncbi:hypothetical protein JE952_002399 [Flavobacterium psychrophilum]|nr:hypothetical protein [Flavobacterium psychrophilum]
MSKIFLIPHPDNKKILYNITQVVKIEKETTSIYWFEFSNGDRIRVFDIDVINKVREFSNIQF